jgi:hypothetical protein
MQHIGFVVVIGSGSMVALYERFKDTTGSWDMGWPNELRALGRIQPLIGVGYSCANVIETCYALFAWLAKSHESWRFLLFRVYDGK